MASNYKTETTLDVAAEIRRRTTRHIGLRTRRCVSKVNDGLSFLILALFAANSVICAITANWLGIFGWSCAIAWLLYSHFVDHQLERFMRNLWEVIDEMERKEGGSHDDE